MPPIVKDKICLCKTPLSDWSPERVNGIWFYDRYQEFVKLFSKNIPTVNFEKSFAQPVFNDETNTIEWFTPMGEYHKLCDTPDETVTLEKQRIIHDIESANNTLSEHDRKYLAPILLSLKSDKVDTITYYGDRGIVFGVWGVMMKKGKVLTDVIIDDINDHRTHHVVYDVQGKGKLSFTDIVRKHGHILGGERDIPTYIPDEGYKALEWLPESPSGAVVDKPLNFTIVFVEIAQPGPKIDSFNVRFVSDERGTLQGQTDYIKQKDDRVSSSEVPEVVPQEGYKFVGWDREPINHIVTEDVVFTAKYGPVEQKKWVWWQNPLGLLSGCLSWLLALLLLGLIAALLWFLLGNHDLNFCGCNCDESIVIPDTIYIRPDTIKPPIEPEPVNPPVKSSCSELQAAGDNNPKSYVFDMGKKNGSFSFEYATGSSQADRITIHDGNSRSDKIIFDYHGTTGDCSLSTATDTIIRFNNQMIFVDVIPDTNNGTCWSIKVNCPEE